MRYEVCGAHLAHQRHWADHECASGARHGGDRTLGFACVEAKLEKRVGGPGGERTWASWDHFQAGQMTHLGVGGMERGLAGLEVSERWCVQAGARFTHNAHLHQARGWQAWR